MNPLSRHALGPIALTVCLALAGAATLSIGGPAQAQAPQAATAPVAGFEAAFTLFAKAGEGDSASVAPAADALARLSQAHPGDAVLLAYAGAAEAMRATTTWLPWKKMSHAEEGLAQLDKALSLAASAPGTPGPRGVPALLETRFVAANTFLALPGFFNRHARGEKLLAETLAHPALAASPLPFRAAVWLRAAKLAKEQAHPDEARRLAQQVLASGAPQAAAAQALLKELGA